MEASILSTRLDLVHTVDHWNTDNPHVHLLVRGVDDTGADSSSRATISAAACGRAPGISSPSSLARPRAQGQAIRWNGRSRRNAGRASTSSASPPTGHRLHRPAARATRRFRSDARRLMISRLQHLEKMGSPTSGQPGRVDGGLDAVGICATSACGATSSDHASRLRRTRPGARRRRLCD